MSLVRSPTKRENKSPRLIGIERASVVYFRSTKVLVICSRRMLLGTQVWGNILLMFCDDNSIANPSRQLAVDLLPFATSQHLYLSLSSTSGQFCFSRVRKSPWSTSLYVTIAGLIVLSFAPWKEISKDEVMSELCHRSLLSLPFLSLPAECSFYDKERDCFRAPGWSFVRANHQQKYAGRKLS